MTIKTIITLMAMGLSTGGLWAAQPLKLLILTGQNNHAWQRTTPVLKEILEKSGRFTVDVTEHPEDCRSFKEYQVVLSNWNTYGKGPAKVWPQETKDNLLEFVRAGGGFVVVHAGGTMYPEWKEFHQLIGGTWGKGTGHGKVHEFEVKFTASTHPVTQGLKAFRTTDELWHRMVCQDDKEILATAMSETNAGGTGNDEPMVMVTNFGKGHGFNLVLGHYEKAMENRGFQLLLTRGAEWSATGTVTLPAE